MREITKEEALFTIGNHPKLLSNVAKFYEVYDGEDLGVMCNRPTLTLGYNRGTRSYYWTSAKIGSKCYPYQIWITTADAKEWEKLIRSIESQAPTHSIHVYLRTAYTFHFIAVDER